MEQATIGKLSREEIRENLLALSIGERHYIESPELNTGNYRIEATNLATYRELRFRVLQDEEKRPYAYRAA